MSVRGVIGSPRERSATLWPMPFKRSAISPARAGCRGTSKREDRRRVPLSAHGHGRQWLPRLHGFDAASQTLRAPITPDCIASSSSSSNESGGAQISDCRQWRHCARRGSPGVRRMLVSCARQISKAENRISAIRARLQPAIEGLFGHARVQQRDRDAALGRCQNEIGPQLRFHEEPGGRLPMIEKAFDGGRNIELERIDETRPAAGGAIEGAPT